MSGSQGRFPPAVPPNPQWRHQGEGERVVNHGQPQQPQWGTPPPGPSYQPQQGHPQQGQPLQGQALPYPPHFQPQPPALPAGNYASPPHPAAQQQYVPQPPPAQNSPPYGYPPQQAHPDQGAYDLGSYTLPSGQPPAPHPGTVRSGRPMQPAPEVGQQWAPQPVEPYPYAGQNTGQPKHAGSPAPLQAGPGFGYQQQQAGANVPAAQHEQDGVDEEDVEYEDPPRRNRKWMIAAALVGSIGLGGGIAYGYKTMLSPKAADKAQVVKAPREPAKVAPSDRGGKQFANTSNSTVMNRLPAEGSANAGGGETDSSGVRRVAVVPVDRNAGPVAASSPNGPANVPGMMMVGGNNPGMAGVMIAPPPSAEPPRTTAPVQSPQRVAVATPPPPPARKVQPAEAPEAAAPPAKRPPVTTVAAAERVPAPPVAERVKPAGPAGYVAVLGYQRTQMEAMKMMADLQQKYEALRDKKLEIVQSDQTSRGLGVIYRVVVGPRGSIAPARDICARLKEAGMPNTGCYPLAAN